MNISIQKTRILVCLLVFGVFFSACEKELSTRSGEHASEELQWSSISDTKAALLGNYALLRAALMDNNAHYMYGELRAGDLISYKRSDLEAINKQELNASYPLIRNLTNWRKFYAVINAASVLIERAPEVLAKDARYTEVNLKYDVAQARAIRAFAYFYMVRIWGDVPLITKAYDDGSFLERPKTDYRTVLSFAENELLKAAQDLPYLFGVNPQTYYGENSGVWSKVLFNKLTAYSILAHISAWQGNYINVDVYTKFILDNQNRTYIQYLNTIAELTSITGVFSNNYGYGQLLSLSSAYAYNEATATGHLEELTLASPLINKQYPDLYVPKDSIVKIFTDQNDTRFGLDTISGLTRTNYFTNYSGEIPVFSKLKIIRDGVVEGNYAVYGSNLVFTRLEDITLLRAEALTVLGATDEAITMLNLVRLKRALKGFNPNLNTSLIEEIFNERRRELMGEGWRWYDQIRLNKIKAVDPALVKLIENKGIYWPISQDVLDKNKLVVQNEYWK